MNKKERETFKRDKIRYLWVYQHLSYTDIADKLNSDPEFVRKCGKIAMTTVAYWVNNKIKPEFENAVNSDAMEVFNAEFMRSVEFIDGEISDLTKIIENEDLKPDDRLRYISMRHRMEIDKMTLLADKALPLSVKKWKKDRQRFTKTLTPIEDDTPITAIIFKDRVKPKLLDEPEKPTFKRIDDND